MKLSFSLLFVFLVAKTLFAQKVIQVSAISEKVFISNPKQSDNLNSNEKSSLNKFPPYLEIKNYNFIDSNNNNKIDAGEAVKICFELSNSGLGTGAGLTLKIEENNKLDGLKFKAPNQLPELKSGETTTIEIPIEGSIDLTDGFASFKIVINEPKGFGANPLEVEIETQSFRPPIIKMVDYQISSNQSRTLEKRKPFDLEILIQNLGQGVAKELSIKAVIPENIYCLTANQSEYINELKQGEQHLISYTFVANNEYRDEIMKFKFLISEKFKRFAEDNEIILTMNQQVSSEKLVVKGNFESPIQITEASLTSDVDKNIPLSNEKFSNKVALIIGNEDYSRSINAEINVEFARRDAEIFSEYVKNTLGVLESNIWLIKDATSGLMNAEIEKICELIKRMGAETELIFYYAGHGFPDIQTSTPYLIPVDVNVSNLSSAIPLRNIFQKFGATNAKKVTVILDACFSGGGRNKGLLAARAVRIQPKEEELSGNMVVFSASTGEQAALSYQEKKHGMFTYFLLKKLQDTNGLVTFGELDKYLKKQVGTNSLRINGKIQDPVTTTSPLIATFWEVLTF